MAGIAAIPLVGAGVEALRDFNFFASTPTVMPRATMTMRNMMMTQSFASSAIS